MERLDYRLRPDDAGITVRVLAARLAGEPGTRAVTRGGAWLGGRRLLDPDEPLPAGATLTLRFPPAGGYAELTLDQADIAYEDDWLVAVHKAAGWYVGATPWDAYGNLLHVLGLFLAVREGALPRLHLAHQLDRDTSGVLLLSRDPAVNPTLQTAFAGGAVAKAYLGICAGVPNWERMALRTGHGRAAGGRWRLYALDEVGRALPAGGGHVKEAHSSFAVERVLDAAALVRAALHTGRTHQIRLHLAHLGHPLLGDTRYGGPDSYQGRPLAGHLLHAATLQLRHPGTGAELTISSPLPGRFTALLES